MAKTYNTAWDRLQKPLNNDRSSAYSFSVKHMPSLLRKLQSIYSPKRERFMHEINVFNAQNIRDHILHNYEPWQVNNAHEACVRDYQENSPRRGYSKPTMDFKRVEVIPVDAEDALFGDDDKHPDKQWLDSITDNEPSVPSVPSEDNAQYVTKPELNAAMHKQQQFMADGVMRLKQGIKADIGSLANGFIDLTSATAKAIEEIKNNKPLQIEIKREGHAPVLLPDLFHRHFPDLLQICRAKLPGDAHLNVWVYGPAGTGKTTAAKQVANVLGLNFHTMGALETGYQILGYNDGNGQYVTTHFRQCWEHGGVIALDECDSYTPSAALALNGALANGFCAFADKLVPRHKDCIVIAGANTTGLGGTIEYVGRAKQDAAFLDRFVMLDWPIDDALEDAICASKEWLRVVRYVRSMVISNSIKGVMITPRATLYGDAMIKAGAPLSLVLRTALKKGMTDAQWSQVAPPRDWDI